MEYLLAKDVNEFHSALAANDVQEVYTDEDTPPRVKQVLNDLNTATTVSVNEYNQLRSVIQTCMSGVSEQTIQRFYAPSDALSDLPHGCSRLPFPLRCSHDFKITNHVAIVTNLSKNTLSNVFYSHVIGDTLLRMIMEVNEAQGKTNSDGRFELLYDAAWRPGQYKHIDIHKGPLPESAGVPGREVWDAPTNTPMMLKPDVFVNFRNGTIDFSFFLGEYKREPDDLSGIEKLLTEGFMTLAERLECVTHEDGTTLQDSPLMWVPLLYCAGTQVYLYLMWIEGETPNPRFRYRRIHAPVALADIFFLTQPYSLLEFTNVLLKLTEKIREQLMYKVLISTTKTIAFKHIGSPTGTGKPPKKPTRGRGNPPADVGGQGDQVNPDATTLGKRKQDSSQSSRIPKKSAPQSCLNIAEILVHKWGAKTFRPIYSYDPMGGIEAVFVFVCPQPVRHPIVALIYDAKITIVKMFKDAIAQKEIDIQSALSEIPGARVPEVLRVETMGDVTVVEMEYVGHAYPIARSMYELKVMCRQLASAMEVIHSHGYVHCDIKPANVAVERKDSQLILSILDWGSAKELRSPRSRFKGDGRGTTGFVAPEMEAHRTCTSAVDIYSLGLTFRYIASKLQQDQPDDENWEIFESMVEKMTQEKPSQRLAASQLLFNCGFLESIP